MRVCFIDHRNIIFRDIKEKLKKTIVEEIKNGCETFMMGTHGDFDIMALEICRELKCNYPNIKIEVVLTSLNKTRKQILFNDEFGEYFYEPYKDVQTVMYEIESVHFRKQIIVSNKKMIDECDTLICYVDKNCTHSGAKTAMYYAKRKGLKIINLFL